MPKRDLVSGSDVVVPVELRDKSEFSGLVDIGSTHSGWLFTKRLFSTKSIQESIRDLLVKTMLRDGSNKAR